MTRYRVGRERSARADSPAGSTAATIHIDYSRDTLEELTALLQRWQHHLAPDATLLLAGGAAPRVLRALERSLRLVSDHVFRGLRRPVTA